MNHGMFPLTEPSILCNKKDSSAAWRRKSIAGIAVQKLASGESVDWKHPRSPALASEKHAGSHHRHRPVPMTAVEQLPAIFVMRDTFVLLLLVLGNSLGLQQYPPRQGKNNLGKRMLAKFFLGHSMPAKGESFDFSRYATYLGWNIARRRGSNSRAKREEIPWTSRKRIDNLLVAYALGN